MRHGGGALTDPGLDCCGGQSCRCCSLDVALSGRAKGCGFRGLAGAGWLLLGRGLSWWRGRAGSRGLLGEGGGGGGKDLLLYICVFHEIA